MKNSIVVVLLVLVVAVLLNGGYVKNWFQASEVRANSSQNMSGYMWSSNIGWISFNCTDGGTCGTNDYGVTVDNGGNLSGYAWNDKVGWISFSENSGCPEAGCVTNPKLIKSSGAITGWARACSETVNLNCTGATRTDGWDGWIKLDGMTPDGNAYGPIVSGSTILGYSWGSDVGGWISWSGSGYGVALPVCLATLTVTPDTVEQGQNVTLSWSVTGGQLCATTCEGSGFSTGGATSGSNVPATVPPTPPTTSYALTCSGGFYDTPPPANATVTLIVPTVTITANNQVGTARVNPAVPNNTTIRWSSANSTSCSVTKNGVAWNSGLSSSGIVDTVTNKTIYLVDCQNSYNSHVTANVNVNILVNFQEF